MLYLIIIISLIFSAFFSGLEMAFVSANKLRIELDNKKGLISGKILSFFINNPSKFIGAVLLGNNMSLVVYGIFMSKLIEPYLKIYAIFEQNAFLLLITQTIISTIIILLTAEFLPKVLFRINPNKSLSFFSEFIFVIYILLYPITLIISKISDFIIIYILRLKNEENKYAFSLIDIDMYISEFSNQNNVNDDIKNEMQFFKNARELPHIKIRECMVPRTEIIAVDEKENIENLKNKFIEHGVSKVLVYADNIDNIIGYAHSFDMFKTADSIKNLTRPILIIPESMFADKLLKTFIQENKSIAVVVDEFGGTSGIITIEDVVEEIFGEIDDEYDIEEFTEKKLSSHEFSFSGRMEIDYLNEKYGLNLPVADEYETLAGLIINVHKSIPQKGEEIIIEPFVFTITDVTETKIEQVNLKIST